MTQQVYILEDKNSGLLKVGISVDVAVRVGQVNKDFGCDAEIIGVLDANDARKTERFIHGMLHDCRVVGEWFEVDEARRGYLLTYFDVKEFHKRVKPQVSPVKTWGLKLTLRQFLNDNGLTAYRLAKASGMPEQTIYSIVREHRKPSYDVVDSILNALSRLTGRTVQVSEILEFIPDPTPPQPEQGGAE